MTTLRRIHAHELSQSRASDFDSLPGLNQLRSRRCQFRFRPGGIGSGAQLSGHLSTGRTYDRLRPRNSSLSGLRRFLSRCQCEIGIEGRRGDFKLRALQARLRLNPRGFRNADVCLTEAEIKRLPTDQPADGAAPCGAQTVGTENWAGDRRNDALRKQHPEDVVSGCAIHLGQGVDVRHIGSPRQANSRRSRVDLFLRHSDGWIVLGCVFDGLH